MLRSEKYLEHFAFLVVVEAFILNAYDHFVFKQASVLLGKQLTRCFPFHLLVPKFLVCIPKGVMVKNWESGVECGLRVFDW